MVVVKPPKERKQSILASDARFPSERHARCIKPVLRKTTLPVFRLETTKNVASAPNDEMKKMQKVRAAATVKQGHHHNGTPNLVHFDSELFRNVLLCSGRCKRHLQLILSSIKQVLSSKIGSLFCSSPS